MAEDPRSGSTGRLSTAMAEVKVVLKVKVTPIAKVKVVLKVKVAAMEKVKVAANLSFGKRYTIQFSYT